MRIRKRYQNPLLPTDPSSPLPPLSIVAAGEARGASTGGKEGEVTAAAPAVRVVAAGGGGGGQGLLHPDGRTTRPTTRPPFYPPPSAAAAAGGEETRGNPPLPAGPPRLLDDGHNKEVPKGEPDEDNVGEIGDAHGRRWNNMDTPRCGSGDAASPKSKWYHRGTRERCTGRTEKKQGRFAETKPILDTERDQLPQKKRRGGAYHARGRSLALEAAAREEEEKVVVGREMKQTRPSSTRRRRAAASCSTTMAAAGTVLTSVGTDNRGGGAPTATGDDAGAPKKCDDMVVKEEGVDVMPAATAAPVDGSRGGHGNGKKRRSPAVLMEGSRCSRVNGRGWRCCQQTLVGYSLCEHHLGKGRLRSVSSVRCNGRAMKKEDVGDHGAAALPLPSLLRQQDQLILSGDGDYYYYEEEEITNPTKRKRIGSKIGMVKARSISSLLHQPEHPSTPTTIAAPEEPFPSPSPTPATRPVTAAAPSSYASIDTAVA